MRQFSYLDRVIQEMDMALRTLVTPENRVSKREVPGKALPDHPLTAAQKKHVSGLMRVNHAGEVCAQGLYQGQALTAKLAKTRQQMIEAAEEETDHLAWCEQRLRELDSKTTLLNPLWYTGSLMLGALAGMAGDRISLGFVAETEHQVSSHLQKHLENLPEGDDKSRLILERMQEDENHHAEMAKQAGAVTLPAFIRRLMQGVSRIMTKTSYHF